MQPYFLPYLPYWQLIHACDTFVLLDDSYYRTRGWINRNRILVQGSIQWMTVPLHRSSQNKRIGEITLSKHGNWKSRLLTTVERAYASAPYRDRGVDILRSILTHSQARLDEFLEHSIRLTAQGLGISTEILSSRKDLENSTAAGLDRVLEICEEAGASVYLNPVRGAFLYETSRFQKKGIGLSFLQAQWEEIDLTSECEEGPTLSILDLLMWNEPQDIAKSFSHFELHQPELAAHEPAGLIYG